MPVRLNLRNFIGAVCTLSICMIVVTNIYPMTSYYQKPVSTNHGRIVEVKSDRSIMQQHNKELENVVAKQPVEGPDVVRNVLIDYHLLNNKRKDEIFFDQELHYNVDDYGVPLEEYLLTVENMKDMTPSERVKKFREKGIKTILYMHAAYGSKTYGFNSDKASGQGQWPYIMKGCRRKDCFCTDQRNFIPMEDFDAILFYSRAISEQDIPKVRKPNQRYILWEVEPPMYLMSFRPERWKNFFNWTHTYRRDSDMWEPWGMINQYKKIPSPVDDIIRQASLLNATWVDEKNKPIAWFVSNCSPRSGRDKFITELQKYIDVDVYGACGTLKCDDRIKCWKLIEKKYYFYFSGENSLCKDYITEKLFNALKYNIIPITFGGGDGTNDYNFMPKMSFINSFDYKSPKELAQYLIELMSDRKKYASYFWWKPFYRIWLGRWKKAHCEICDQLHENKKEKSYADIKDWWVQQAKCRSPWR